MVVRSRHFSSRPRLAVALACCAATTALGGPAGAQPVDNSFAVDLFQGPILAPTRVTSMGGAYAGYAEGISGFVSNAAAPAVREPFSSGWVDMDIQPSISVPLDLFENNDFDNSGDVDADYSNFIYLSIGTQLQLGPFGAGFFGDLQRYALSFPSATAAREEETVVTVGRYHVLFGWHFFNNQLVAGGGIRALTLGVAATDADLTITGLSPQLGFLIKPDWTPFRFGATYRHAVSAGTSIGSGRSVDEAGVERAGRLILPDRVELPWEVELGVAVQVGSRPLNPAWIDPTEHEEELRQRHAQRARKRRQRADRQLASLPPGTARERVAAKLEANSDRIERREQRQLEQDLERLRDERRARFANWPREGLLMNLDLLVTGPVQHAISLERFLGQGQPVPAGTPCVAVASGEDVNFSPRLGLEMEPVRRWVHTRFGTYYEPPRYTYSTEHCNDRVGRQHFTFGADLKLFTTTWWGLVPEVTYKVQGYGDLAPRYQSFG
ncbi:MAG: YqkE family protein, partial [Deltaproteobacteria bacterium]|nr:YqkE family protein [Deltaproteobacteria bacterium]